MQALSKLKQLMCLQMLTSNNEILLLPSATFLETILGLDWQMGWDWVGVRV
jgi:hypothetical protein